MGWRFVAAAFSLTLRRVLGWLMISQVAAQFDQVALTIAIWRGDRLRKPLHYSD